MPRCDKSLYRVGAFIEGATYAAFTKGIDDVVEKSARYRAGDFIVAGHYPVTIAKGVERLREARERNDKLAAANAAMEQTIGVNRSFERDLRALFQKHGVEPDRTRCELPLGPPVDPPCIVEGIAATTHILGDRTCFGVKAFTLPERPQSIPLLISHDVKRPAGWIEDLSLDVLGNLHIRAWVDSRLGARLNGFSVGTRTLDYIVRNADSRAFYIECTSVELLEVSLAFAPRNRRALVTSRRAPTAVELSSRRLIDSVEQVRRTLASMRKAA